LVTVKLIWKSTLPRRFSMPFRAARKVPGPRALIVLSGIGTIQADADPGDPRGRYFICNLGGNQGSIAGQRDAEIQRYGMPDDPEKYPAAARGSPR